MPFGTPRDAGRQPGLVAALTVLLCALTSPAWAQTTLSGIVHDPNGRVAAGVPVVAEQIAGPATASSANGPTSLVSTTAVSTTAAGASAAPSATAAAANGPDTAVAPAAPAAAVAGNGSSGTGTGSSGTGAGGLVPRWDTVSTDIGYYEFPRLPAGRYRISIELPPFRPVTAEVSLSAERRAVLDIALRLGSDERITVEGRGAGRPLGALELSGVATVAQFSRTELDTLALTNGRTVQSVQTLVPGLLFTDSVGTLAQFTAVGQRRFSNRMTIDGMSADLGVDVRGSGLSEGGANTLPGFATSGGTQTLVPMDAVEEIQVRTTNAAPEFARTPGAQTAIVTRAGGDRLTGTGFLSNRPNALTASDWFANAGRAPTRTLDFWNGGASLGGPVVPGRLFYFGTWEGQQLNRPMTTTVPVPSLATRAAAAANGRPWLNAFPMPNGADLEGGLAEYTHAFPVESQLSSASLRMDATLSNRHRLFARFNRGVSDGDALGDTLALPFYGFSNREEARTLTATTGLSSVLGSSWTNDLRANISHHRGTLTAAPAAYGNAGSLSSRDLVPSALADDAWLFLAAFPGSSGFVLSGQTGGSSQQQVEIADTLTLARGRHLIRLGVDYTGVTTTMDGAANRFTYRFANLGELVQGRARSVLVGNQLDTRVQRHSFAAFVQDTIRIAPRLTVDFGLRYRVQPPPTSGIDAQPLLLASESLPDLQPLPSGTPLWNTSWTNLAPQVAATYQLHDTFGRETIVRAGWNMVYDDLASPGVTALSQGYPFISRRFVPGTRLPVPDAAMLNQPAPLSEGDASEYFALPRNLRAPRTSTWQVGVEQALGGAQRVSLAYVGAASRDLLYRYSYLTGNSVQMVTGYTNDARSDYHALLAEFVRRLSRGLQARAVYTWSHAIDTDSGEQVDPNPPPWLLSPSLNRASADFDRRHALQTSVSYRVPTLARLPGTLRTLASDWQVDVVGTFRSGAPLTVRATGEFGGAFYTARPDLVPDQPLWVPDPTSPTGKRLNAAAFSDANVIDRQGTLGRNALRATWLRQVDLAVSRNLRLGGRMTALLRVEAFNVFNLQNFGPPMMSYGVAEFGAPFQSYADALGTGTLARGGLLPVQQVGSPRSLQVTIRLGF